MPKTQINLKIEEEKKGEWEEFVENRPDMDSLTALIRRSVSEFIYRQEEDDESGVSEDLLIDNFESIQSRLDNIENATKAIQMDQLTEDDVQLASLKGFEEFLEAEGVDLSKLPMSDKEEWRR